MKRNKMKGLLIAAAAAIIMAGCSSFIRKRKNAVNVAVVCFKF